MKKIISFILLLSIIPLISLPAQARDTQLILPISDAMGNQTAKEKLAGSVRFFFKPQPSPPVTADFGNAIYSRKTNVTNKSNVAACNWAFLSAMVALKKDAQKSGANAVVNIMSYYDRQAIINPQMFECRVGLLMAAVTLKGDIVNIK